MIVGGALVSELTHLDAGFFASPGATAEVVHEHRGRFGLPPTFLHHRQASMVEVETGAHVSAGQTLFVIEAMKMQNIIKAERDGVVKSVNVKPGESVAADEVLVELA